MTLGKCEMCGHVNESETAMCSRNDCTLGGGPFARQWPVKPQDANDPINPAHYQGDYVMRIIEDFALNFRIGNVVKYCLRAENKGKLVDLKKAAWYLQREIASLGK